MTKAIFTPTFKLNALKNIPAAQQLQAEKIRMVYEAFENVSTAILDELGVPIETPYHQFLKEELNGWIETLQEVDEKFKSGELTEKKRHWNVISLQLVFNAIHMGHWKIEEAHITLKSGLLPEFTQYMAEASVNFGRLQMIWDLCQRGVFGRIGSLQSSLSGATLGGIRSGSTRRKQSAVPTPEALRNARVKLVEAGKPQREIAAMLAKKYNCTTDYIRKILKRD